MPFALLGALLAAVGYGAATIAQAVGVRRLQHRTGRGGWTWLRAAWPYAAGLVLDLVSFVATVAALRSLPLFLVESAVASSVAVTAVLAAVLLHQSLAAREWVAVAGVVAGLALLALGAHSGPATTASSGLSWGVLAAAVVTAGLLLVGIRLGDDRLAALVLAGTAGLGFGGVGVAARLLVVGDPWWSVAGEPLGWALVVHGVLGTVAFAYALSRGRVAAVAAVTFVVETVVPAALGLLWLGDSVRAGWTLVAVTGFVLTLGACLVLASRAEPEVPVSQRGPVRGT